MTVADRIAKGLTAIYNRSRSKHAIDAAATAPTGSIDDLKGRKYCLLVTYKKDGTAVPTPLWFGVGDGKVFAHTGAEDYKVKRLRRNPTVLIAPCDTRGAPSGPPFAGTARVVPKDEEPAANRFIQANYGWYRTVYNRLLADRVAGAYVEVTPTVQAG